MDSERTARERRSSESAEAREQRLARDRAQQCERRASETAETRERRLARNSALQKVQKPGSSGWQGTELDSENAVLRRLRKHVTVGYSEGQRTALFIKFRGPGAAVGKAQSSTARASCFGDNSCVACNIQLCHPRTQG